MSAGADSARPYVVVAGAEDGPDGERVIEAAAASLGNRVGGELHILHLSPESELRSEATLALLEHGRSSIARVASEQHAAPQGRVFVHIRSGSPWREIVDEARKLPADLIVVGTHGRTGAARLLFGSQGEQVLRHAPCPVLVVRGAHATTEDAPEIEPPCPSCVEVRKSSQGASEWCEVHAKHHVTPHLHYSFPPGFGAGSWLFRP